VALEIVHVDLDAGLVAADERQHDRARVHPAKAHAEQREERHPDAREQRREPQAERDELEEDHQDDDGDERQRQHHAQAQHRFIHGKVLEVKGKPTY
jgi:hypothetical protein